MITINDNKNNGNVTKCWNIEKYTVIDQCFKCDSFSMNFLFSAFSKEIKEAKLFVSFVVLVTISSK